MIIVSRVLAYLWRLAGAIGQRDSTVPPRRTLVIHQMLLGDGILLMPALQGAATSPLVTVACPGNLIELYKVFFPKFEYIKFSEKKPLSVISLLCSGPYREVIFPFERRMARYALALNAKAIRTFVLPEIPRRMTIKGGGTPTEPTTLSDLVTLLFPKHRSMRFIPLAQICRESSQRKCILHVDARNPNRRWTPRHWNVLASLLRSDGFLVVWCFGENSNNVAASIDTTMDEVYQPGSLVEYLDKIRSSALLICPDTGIAHLGKLTMTPSVIIYGQGTPLLHGNGQYWAECRSVNVHIQDIPCRDKDTAVGLKLSWLRRCDRSPKDCSEPFCQNSITPMMVLKAASTNFPELFKNLRAPEFRH